MSNVSIVCVTCDKYARLMPGFYHFLDRYWPGRTWPLQVVAERESPWLPQSPRYFYYYYDEDRRWASNMLRFLAKAAPEIIVLLLDDYYLSESADDDTMRQLVAMIEGDESIGYINLRPWSDDVIDGEDWTSWQQISGRPMTGEYDEAVAPYLLSLQPGIWRSDFLRWLLKAGEDHWDTEREGTIRARKASLRMLACLWPFPLPYVNVTRYGVYRDGSREWLMGEIGETHAILADLDELFVPGVA